MCMCDLTLVSPFYLPLLAVVLLVDSQFFTQKLQHFIRIWTTAALYKKISLNTLTQCSPSQVVTGKIYHLKQHFLPPATTSKFTKIK